MSDAFDRGAMRVCTAIASLVLGVMIAPTTQAQTSSIQLVLHSSTIVVSNAGAGPVAVDLVRAGERFGFASGLATSSTPITLSLELAYGASGGQATIQPGDIVTITAVRIIETIVVPELFADLDTDIDVIAGVFPEDLPATLVVHDAGGVEVIRDTFLTDATRPWVYPAAIDLTQDHVGYVDLALSPNAVVRTRFAPVLLVIDVADVVAHGSSTPGAWLTIIAEDLDGRRVSQLVRGGWNDDTAAVVGPGTWTASLMPASMDNPSFVLAGGTVTVIREELIVPGAVDRRTYPIAPIAVTPLAGRELAVSGQAVPGADIEIVTRPLFGAPAVTTLAANPDGSWTLPMALRPGDRATVALATADALIARHTVAPPHAFLVPGAASMLLVDDHANRAGARLTDPSSAELAQLQFTIADGWASSAFQVGAATVAVQPGSRIRIPWDRRAEDEFVVPFGIVTPTRATGVLQGRLWPNATATVYQQTGTTAVPIADITADANGHFMLPLDGPPFDHDVRGVVVANATERASVLLAWAVPEPMIDLYDSAIRMIAPSGASHSISLLKGTDRSLHTVSATASPPRSIFSARQWLHPSRLPFRETELQFVQGIDEVVGIGVGDLIALQDEREPIEVEVRAVRATIGEDGIVAGRAEGASRIDVVMEGGPQQPSVRRTAGTVDTEGAFAVDLSDVIEGSASGSVVVESFVPAARIRAIASLNRIEVGLHDGSVAGRTMPDAAVSVALRRADSEVARAVLESDGIGDYAGWLRGSTGDAVALESGDRLEIVFEGIRAPVVWATEVPPLTVAIDPGTAHVAGRGPSGAALVVGASFERTRIIAGLMDGATTRDGGLASATLLADADGSYAGDLVSQSLEPFHAGPGTRVSVVHTPRRAVSFRRDVLLPLLGIEVEGARVRLLTDALTPFRLELSDRPAGSALAEVEGQTDEVGFVDALWTRDGAPFQIAPGAAVSLDLAGVRTAAEQVVPFRIDVDWQLNVLRAITPAGRPIYSASGRCVPWGGGGLAPIPDADKGATSLPLGNALSPGIWYVAGVFGADGHFLFREAIRPLVILDPSGFVRGCATPYADVSITVLDEGGADWAHGEGTVDARGWYDVALRRNDALTPIRPTDSVVAEIEGVQIEKPSDEPFGVAVDGNVATIHGTPGQKAIVIADLGLGFKHRLPVADAGQADLGVVRLDASVAGRVVHRWLVVVTSAANDGHFVGTVLVPDRLDAHRTFIPFSHRP